MSRSVPTARIRTYGIYTQWDNADKSLPECTQITKRIPAVVDLEFGLTICIKSAKNRPLTYQIVHPGILDDHGRPRPPFVGTVFPKTNNWDFFLGDTIWLPIADKIGPWKLQLLWNQKPLISHTLTVYAVPDILDAGSKDRG